MVVDHINSDSLDNRRSNLRVCTVSQNNMNSAIGRNNKSGYKGVSWDKTNKKWRAGIKAKGKSVSLGSFNSKKDAARAYNEAAKKAYGEFAKLNIL